jgi:hypothetical protein
VLVADPIPIPEVRQRQHLGYIAHVEQRSADRAFVEMIGLGSILQPTRLNALTVDHIALGSIVWGTRAGDAKN